MFVFGQGVDPPPAVALFRSHEPVQAQAAIDTRDFVTAFPVLVDPKSVVGQAEAGNGLSSSPAAVAVWRGGPRWKPRVVRRKSHETVWRVLKKAASGHGGAFTA